MVAWGPNGQDIFERTYSRVKADGSKETWEDTVDRVVEGNLALVPAESHLPGEREKLHDLILLMKAIPAGRHLWTTGVPGRQFVRNCHRAGWGPDLSDHFTFLFNELMKGGGVGANYSHDYLIDLPPIVADVTVSFQIAESHPDYEEVCNSRVRVVSPSAIPHLIVPDSREGWVDALGYVIDLFTAPGSFDLVIDISDIRPRGSVIKGFGGTSSGPAPLAQMLTDVVEILNCANGTLCGLDAMAVDHAISQCVIAGNVRRSARMSVMHWQDPDIFEFIQCKAENGNHWSTNISVEITEEFIEGVETGSDVHAIAVFEALTEGMLLNGEPGFYNTDLASVGEYGDIRAQNPCGEATLMEWEACNLGHVNLSAFAGDTDGASEAFRLMARFLIRATFAELTDDRQREVEGKNRRIGVGFFGFQEWLAQLGIRYSEAPDSPEVIAALQHFHAEVREAANDLADTLGIPHPVKTTAIAPTGTIAKLPGTTEGIHPVYSRYYERRVRYAANDPALEGLAERYPIEDCIYSPNTKVVVYTVRDTIMDHAPADLIEQADEIELAQMFAVQRLVQTCYTDQAVSFTANINPDTPIDTLRSSLLSNMRHLKGTTVMPDLSRPQSPYTRITEAEYNAATEVSVGQSYDECPTGACPVK